MKFSIIIAIYNRPDELGELLQSLTEQTDKNFEVIVVDDGSRIDLQPVVENFKHKLNILYHKQKNTGPGYARNAGTRLANGDYFIFLDSDCIAPPTHIQTIRKRLEANYTDAFGGPDAAHPSFNHLQKAISYAMTSLITTGGIRGKKQSVGKFQPRSFNMGVSKQAFEKVGGFSELRIGEDPDLSMTLWENGYSTQLIEDAYVYHKRRNSLMSFAKQVYQFGVARPILFKRHPKFIRISFFAPSAFLLFTIFCLTGAFFSLWTLIPLIVYQVAIFLDAYRLNKDFKVALFSIITSNIQWYAYGWGFLISFIRIWIFDENPKNAFPSHFYQMANS